MTTPAGQRWTRNKPEVEGWYWFRSYDEPESIVQVYQHVDGPWCMSGPEMEHCEILDKDHDEDGNDVHTEWQGPLSPHEATA